MTTDTPLLPPKRELGRASHHWVQRIDYDGRSCGLEVYQWQPYAKKWCLPNEYASGRDTELLGYQYVALCPTPPFAEEVAVVLELVKNLNLQSTPELDTMRRLVGEHIDVLPRAAR